MHVLGQARLNDIEFAMVALCAVEHPRFHRVIAKRINVNIKDLLRASEAGAKVGTKAWRLIEGAVAEVCGENEGFVMYDPLSKKTHHSV